MSQLEAATSNNFFDRFKESEFKTLEGINLLNSESLNLSSTASYWPEYGATVLTKRGGMGKVHYKVLGLDSWNFTINDSREDAFSHEAVPKEWVILYAGSTDIEDESAVKGRLTESIKFSLANRANGRGKMSKTPTFLCDHLIKAVKETSKTISLT